MAILPITSLFAAAFAVALVALSFPISLRRLKVGDMVGDSADDVLRRRIRAQGNFIECVPLGVVILGLVETQAAPAWIVVAIGAVLAVGRVLHAVGMLSASGPVRGIGMIFTWRCLSPPDGSSRMSQSFEGQPAMSEMTLGLQTWDRINISGLERIRTDGLHAIAVHRPEFVSENFGSSRSMYRYADRGFIPSRILCRARSPKPRFPVNPDGKLGIISMLFTRMCRELTTPRF